MKLKCSLCNLQRISPQNDPPAPSHVGGAPSHRQQCNSGPTEVGVSSQIKQEIIETLARRVESCAHGMGSIKGHTDIFRLRLLYIEVSNIRNDR